MRPFPRQISALGGVLTRRYAAAWGYLVALCAAQITYALLPAASQAQLLAWASTSVHNLARDPLGCLVASAFFSQGSSLTWPALTALAVFGACQALGSWRAATVCAVGHVLGTLVSEGIVYYRVTHGLLPAADRYLTDVGPSYVVVTAIVVALAGGGWLARAAATLDLALLVFPGGIFDGLTTLQVAPVGHATAMVTGAVLAGLFLRRRWPSWGRAPAGEGVAEAPGTG